MRPSSDAQLSIAKHHTGIWHIKILVRHEDTMTLMSYIKPNGFFLAACHHALNCGRRLGSQERVREPVVGLVAEQLGTTEIS
jgi:hypothetical protein